MRSRPSSPMSNFSGDSQKGFSLVELLIVLVIGLILMGFAIPVVQDAMRNYTMNTAATNVTRVMQLARYSAIRQGGNSCTVLVGRFFGADVNCNGALGNTEFQMNLPIGVSLTNAGPGTTAGMDFSAAPTAVVTPFVITFNSRGSTTVSPTASVIYLTGWGKFTAVTVTGAGRAHTWQYNGTTWR